MGIKTINTKGRKIFVFGDIHGSIGEFRTLFLYLEENKIISPADILVFIGDYIDRGNYSNEVVEYLIDIKYNYPDSYFIKGNHEDMFLGYFGIYPENAEAFLRNGGRETLVSYDVNYKVAPERAVHQISPLHFKFYSELLGVLITEDFIFVHAGLNLDYKLDEQIEIDTLWIRDEFIAREHDFGKIVVFGHTPFKDVFVDLPYKIGIDTGICYGNKLSCVNLTDWKCYQIGAAQEEVVEGTLARP